jgi:hypothetical protein
MMAQRDGAATTPPIRNDASAALPSIKIMRL